MARRLLILSANLISLASLLFFGAVSICLRFRSCFGSVVVSHFHDDIGNLCSELCRWRATQNKTANSYVVAIAI
jgi:hypothetical protein